jgi:hypothetical protein
MGCFERKMVFDLFLATLFKFSNCSLKLEQIFRTGLWSNNIRQAAFVSDKKCTFACLEKKKIIESENLF